MVQGIVEFGDLFLNGRNPLLDQAGELKLRFLGSRLRSQVKKIRCNVDLGKGICEPFQDVFNVLYLIEAVPCLCVFPTHFGNGTCAHDDPSPPDLKCVG